MQELAIGAASALWFGILTSISPCPLATNIAAISYIGRRVGSTRQVLLAGLLYTAGRMVAYLGLAFVLVYAALSNTQVSLFLQKYVHVLLGPVLILVGMLLLGLIQFNTRGSGVGERLQKRVDAMGIWGALLLGVVFALSFCPTSAGLFFGNLMSSVKASSPILMPLVYGIGTALPVLLFAGLIAFSAQSVGKAFNILSKIEWWARTITGVIFVAVGILLCLEYCLGIPIISSMQRVLGQAEL